MDILSHAAAGAATGALFGQPALGAFVAVVPDIVLLGERRAVPTAAYNWTHSVAFAVACTVWAAAIGSSHLASLVALCLLSHLVLDLPTHGEQWGPTLLYPYSDKRFSMGEEWEFFNFSWWRGLCLTGIWIVVCLALL